MTRLTPAESAGAAQVGTCRDSTPTEIGAVVDLGDPDVLAAEIIEAGGADFGRRVAAWVLLLAEEVE